MKARPGHKADLAVVESSGTSEPLVPPLGDGPKRQAQLLSDLGLVVSTSMRWTIHNGQQG